MNKKNAFSLMELAVVLSIVAIVVAGMIEGSRLIAKSKLATARTITKGSPVSSFKSLAFWLETTSEKSFLDSEVVDEGSITAWYDINPVTTTPKSAASSGVNRPTYIANCIVSLPCLRFSGSNFMDTENLRINSTSISYFIVLKPTELPTASDASLISTEGEYSTITNSVQFKIKSGSNQGKIEFIAANGTQDLFSTSVIAADNFYIISALDNGSNVKFFINGTAAGGPYSSPYANKTLEVVNIGSFNDGTTRVNFFKGDIGEIIIFDEELKAVDRQYIEDYLSKKWHFRY